jgi:hypothetical protein
MSPSLRGDGSSDTTKIRNTATDFGRKSAALPRILPENQWSHRGFYQKINGCGRKIRFFSCKEPFLFTP